MSIAMTWHRQSRPLTGSGVCCRRLFLIYLRYEKVEDKITITELSEMAEKMYGNLVKGVVDLERNVPVVDAEMQA